MGWGRTLLLGDIGNRLDIQDTENDIGKLRQNMRKIVNHEKSQKKQIEALIEENAELKLYLASLMRLLTAKGTITKEELTVMVSAIDVGDGRADGKYDGNIV